MNSQIHMPRAERLKKIIHAIWQVEGRPAFKTEQIIPKGVIEIIFDLGSSGSIQAQIDGKQLQLPLYFINGFNNVPLHLQLPEKQYYLGVQLHPGMVKHLLGIPAREFNNRPVDLALVDKNIHSLWYRLAEAAGFPERVDIISSWLLMDCFNKSPQEEMIDQFLLNPYSKNYSVSGLARELCYSPRQLSRKFYGLTGMNTEDTLLYKRYLHAVHLLHRKDLSLTQVAYESNFTDQSHFIRTFRSFTRMTPGDYRKQQKHIPGHFYQDVR